MTTSRFAPRFWRPRPKYILFAMIALMMLVVVHKDLILLDPSPAVSEHYRLFKWWLLPHGVAGAAALFLGPLQFSDRYGGVGSDGIVWWDESTSGVS